MQRQTRVGRVFVSAMVLFLAGCRPDVSDSAPWDVDPPASVAPFLPSLMSSRTHTHSGVLSPRGDAVFLVTSDLEYRRFEIQVARFVAGTISTPERLAFGGNDSDHAPHFSPEGDRLFFSSTRPIPDEVSSRGWRLWTAGPDGADPRPVAVDDTGLDWMSHASLAVGGGLYFQARREGGGLDYDIYRAAGQDGAFQAPVRLGTGVNTTGPEATPFVDPGGRYLIFAAYDRPDGFGGGDLYVSRPAGNGDWGPARNLGPAVNGPADESNPVVTTDGRALVFASSRATPGKPAGVGDGATGEARSDQNLYWIGTAALSLHPGASPPPG